MPIPRKGFATMQINSFTAENLTAALTEAKVRVTSTGSDSLTYAKSLYPQKDKMLDPNQEVESPYRRTSPTRAKTTVDSEDRSAFSDDDDDFNFNDAVKEVMRLLTHHPVSIQFSLLSERYHAIACF